MNELIIEAKIENMNAVQDFINAQISDCSQSIQNQIGMVIDEIFSNIANYAYGAANGDALIRIIVDDNIILEFEDSGEPYNPLLNEDPDITLGIDERAIGGLGFFLVKDTMDSVEYRHEGNKNILTISKKL